MTRFLLIETSTEKGIVALVEDQRVLFSHQLPPGLQSSNYLLPVLDEAMRKVGIKLSTIDCIGVGIGPGSYTGIRVGVIVAKTLSFSLNLPLVGICSLQTFIPSISEGKFGVIIDAKIGGVYLQLGEMKGGVPIYNSEPEVRTHNEAVALLSNIPVIVTPNGSSLKSKFPAIQAEWQENYPQPEQMERIVKERLCLGEIISDQQLELLYMRKTQAEIEKENNSGKF